MTIYIFGDSIALGLWDNMGGWVDRLKRYIQAEEVRLNVVAYNKVYNLGVDGDLTRNIILRFKNETESRLYAKEERIFIFATGINDTVYKNMNAFESSPQLYANELHTITTMAKKYSQKIYFVDINPVNELLTQPLKNSSTGKCYDNKRINIFNNTLHTYCRNNNILCANINDRFMASYDYKTLLLDGIHPNDEGHLIIFKEILPIVTNFLKYSNI